MGTNQNQPEVAESLQKLVPWALWVAVTTYLDYKARYGSVLLRAFLVDRLAKALPGADYSTRERVFNLLVEAGLLRTWRVPGPEGRDVVVFAPNEENADVKQLLEDLQDL